MRELSIRPSALSEPTLLMMAAKLQQVATRNYSIYQKILIIAKVMIVRSLTSSGADFKVYLARIQNSSITIHFHRVLIAFSWTNRGFLAYETLTSQRPSCRQRYFRLLPNQFPARKAHISVSGQYYGNAATEANINIRPIKIAPPCLYSEGAQPSALQSWQCPI